eukprot:CAMPEP_0117425922 /NCGR_PEP_ID=MMETSP0758-20121206/6133_1 /TAXON_ID=63605 /ORGANISM="Percolomonas cosmopolitus, Strain AE-1 (ATCC 50343)" /LENGTH=488 /DNA_ID=CAMNT_0005210769 /DNA_START=33 /DNA_END=1499 /DNA_ORIENTATION=-
MTETKYEEVKETIIKEIRAIEEEESYKAIVKRRLRMNSDDDFEIRAHQKKELNRPRVRELKTELSSLADHKERVSQRRVTKQHLENLETQQFQPKLNPRNVIATYIKENYPVNEEEEEGKEELKRVMRRYTGIERVPHQFNYCKTGGEYLDNLKCKVKRNDVPQEWKDQVTNQFMQNDSAYITAAVQQLKALQERRNDLMNEKNKVVLSTIAQVQLNVNVLVPPHVDTLHKIQVPHPLYDNHIDIMVLYQNEREKDILKEKLFDVEKEPCVIQYMSLYQFKRVNREKKAQKMLANGVDLVLVNERFWNEVHKKKFSDLLSKRNQLYPVNYKNIVDEVKSHIFATRVFINYATTPIRIACGQVELEENQLVDNIHAILQELPYIVPGSPLNNITSLSLTMDHAPGLSIYENLMFENTKANEFEEEERFAQASFFNDYAKRLLTTYETENGLPLTHEDINLEEEWKEPEYKRKRQETNSPGKATKKKRTK